VALSQDWAFIDGCCISGENQSEAFESEESPPGSSRESTLRKEISQLQRVLAEKTLEVDFFKGALQKVEARRRNSGMTGEKASTTKIQEVMPMQGSLSIERMCQLAGVSRAGFYRSLQEAGAGGGRDGNALSDSGDLRSEQSAALRPIGGFTAELRRRGMRVNHKRGAADSARR